MAKAKSQFFKLCRKEDESELGWLGRGLKSCLKTYSGNAAGMSACRMVATELTEPAATDSIKVPAC